jgi:type VI secretion system protein ImpA
VSVIDIDRLLEQISPEAPSGANDLGHDPAFLELELESQGTPAIEVGDKVVQEARDPDWSRIQKSAIELLARAHDLRVVVVLTRALLHTDGFQGFSDGLKLLYRYVEGYWGTLYPQLDPEDDNDPTERVNILEALTDWSTIITPLMKVKLCSSRTVGDVNLRQYRIATGKIAELTVSDEEKKTSPSLGNIEGAFADCDLDELQINSASVAGGLHALTSLHTVFDEKVGAASAPDLQKLNDVLREMDTLLKDQLSRRESLKSLKSQERPERIEQPKKPATIQDRRVHSSAERRSFEMIESREDVLHVLDQVCAYYELFEPTSPVPLLVKRAMRLVEKNFLEIIEDLAPDTIAQIEKICGSKEVRE